jgi:hypothetical protein
MQSPIAEKVFYMELRLLVPKADIRTRRAGLVTRQLLTPLSQGIYKKSERWRMLTTAWIVKVISRKRRTPITQHFYEASAFKVRAHLIFG